MGENRVPDHFSWSRYGIGPGDITRLTLGCDPDRVRPLVVLAPVWPPEVLADHVDSSASISDGLVKVDDVTCGGLSFSYVRSGIGAPLAGDVTIALGCTGCSHMLFIGSAGGLSQDEQIGDLALPTHSITGDGFSGYLAPSSGGPDFLLGKEVAPDSDFQAVVAACASDLGTLADVAVHTGSIFSTDTILGQFHHLDWMIQRFGCIGIEMETAAVFRVARLVGIKAAALLQFSDVIPAQKSLFSGRTPRDQARRREVRSTVLAEAVIAALRSVAGSPD